MKTEVEPFRQKLEYKVLALILIILVFSFGIIFYLISNKERENLLKKEREKSIFIANMIHETLDKDMMAFRADLVRHLIEDVSAMPGILRLQVVRGDGPYLGEGQGIEEGFQDFKTLDDVKLRIKTLYRPQWESAHNKKTKIAEGSDNPRFQEYFQKVVYDLKNDSELAKAEEQIREDGILDISYMETVNGIKAMTYLRPLPLFPKCALCHGTDHALRGILMVTTSMEAVNLDVKKSQQLLILLSVITIVILLFLMRIMIRKIILNPLNQVVDRVKDIAEGDGDLTSRIHVETHDEIGAVGQWVNVFMEKLHHIISQVSESSKQLNLSSKELLKGKQAVSDGASVQAKAVQITTSASKEMQDFAKEIGDRTESLAELAQESATATFEMSTSIDQIAKSTVILSQLVEDTTSSILEMSSSVKQIDDNVDSLSVNAKESTGSMEGMDSSISQIRESVLDTVQLSKGVIEDAERGKVAVEQTARWIHQTQEYSKQIELVIDNLKGKTANIGKILEVIDEVADQTNLLALNAAIIAAEAGEHGKSFSVVAQEIKELADRTAISTKEIHGIIRELQEQSNNAAAAIQQGSSSVEEGVTLSKEAMSALNKIVGSSQQSTERIQDIAKTTDEQMVVVRRVSESMKRIHEMVKQVGKATHEQSKGSESIIKATDKVRDVAVKLKGATQEQSVGNKHISQIIERVNRMVKDIQEATSKQTKESKNIVSAMERIDTVIQQNMDTIKNVGTTIDSQMKETDKLSSEINKFKL